MATISTGGGHGRKPIQHEVPLVPFIDLLLCCVMFLLVTAVWNQLAALQASQQTPGPPSMAPPPAPLARLTLSVFEDGYTIAGTAGEMVSIANRDGQHDDAMLAERLASFNALSPGAQLTIAPDDGVRYQRMVMAMDVALAAGFEALTVSDRAFGRQ